MNEQRDIELVNELLVNSSELTWLEFKKDNFDPELIGKLCSALSNGARIADRDFGYVIWGINDANTQVIGTCFNPDLKKKGNQPFQL